MHNYDFLNLSPLEFESLANDLISRKLGVHVERFKPGKDLGIDGRFYQADSSTCIIQSKHYATSGYKALYREISKNELKKIRILNPARYIIVTSVPLSPYDKCNLCNILTPYVINTADIVGKDDINALIAEFPQIERDHFKLWISSSTVLNRFLNAATYDCSDQVLKEAISANRYYSPTSLHPRAKQILEDKNVLVITGAPGVGKTTLAEQLCLESVAEEYELIVISNGIEDGRSVYDSSKKQIFYFDDFLGRSFLETLMFNFDSKITRFIAQIHSSKNKRFILTSRTTILDQGYRVGQAFSHSKLKKDEFIIDINRYSNLDKATILYSFMWRSDLTIDYLDKILQERKYNTIINHRNFNPRIIEFVTSNDHCKDISPINYIHYVETSLNNPKDVWDHPYTTQLDDLSRFIVDIIVLSNCSITEEDLKNIYSNFVNKGNYSYTGNNSKDFDSVARTLCRSFIKRQITTTSHTDTTTNTITTKNIAKYSTFNPSVSDYVLNRYLNNPSIFADMILELEKPDNLLILEKLAFTHPEIVNNVASIIIKKIGHDLNSESFIFITRIGNVLKVDSFNEIFRGYNLEFAIFGVMTTGCASEYTLKFIDRILGITNFTNEEASDLFNITLDHIDTYDNLSYLSTIISYCSEFIDYDNSFSKSFYSKLLYLWEEDAADQFINENIEEFSALRYYADEEGGVDQDLVIDEDKLIYLVCNSTESLIRPIELEDARNIVSNFDLDKIASKYYEDNHDESSGGYGNSSYNSEIDDVFIGLLESKFQ